jgi:phosphoenolpyruvate carboxykinase (ATP)
MKTESEKEESLRKLGLLNLGNVHWDLSTPALYEEAIRRYEATLSHLGPLVIRTGQYTGRLPKDKFLVREPSSEDKIWWGKINRPFEPVRFDALKNRLCAYLQGKDIFIQNCYAGADERFRTSIRIISQRASHALFARTMFIQELDLDKLAQHRPEFTVLHAPDFHADPETDGTHSEAFVLLHFGEKLILIGGTAYAGEIKKSIFTVMNYLLPQRGVMAMHCSANYGKDENDVAIFFGLSGTGKTTLSADRNRTLIGDDEHGWSDHGVFNFEGGCYAKVIRLSSESEPEIYETTRRFGTILENVSINNRTRRIDLNDSSLTENTRAAYPIPHIPNITRRGMGGHPKNIFEIEFSINLQDSTLSIFSFFSRADDAGPDAAYATLTLPLDAVPTNPRTVYKIFVAANTRVKWLIPVYGRVFRRAYREFISLFLPPEPH